MTEENNNTITTTSGYSHANERKENSVSENNILIEPNTDLKTVVESWLEDEDSDVEGDITKDDTQEHENQQRIENNTRMGLGAETLTENQKSAQEREGYDTQLNEELRYKILGKRKRQGQDETASLKSKRKRFMHPEFAAEQADSDDESKSSKIKRIKRKNAGEVARLRQKRDELFSLTKESARNQSLEKVSKPKKKKTKKNKKKKKTKQ